MFVIIQTVNITMSYTSWIHELRQFCVDSCSNKKFENHYQDGGSYMGSLKTTDSE
jgi:hypothetical protein